MEAQLSPECTAADTTAGLPPATAMRLQTVALRSATDNRTQTDGVLDRTFDPMRMPIVASHKATARQ